MQWHQQPKLLGGEKKKKKRNSAQSTQTNLTETLFFYLTIRFAVVDHGILCCMGIYNLRIHQ